MATKLLHKRGTSDPSTSDLDVGEIGINTTDGGIFTKTAGGSIVEAGGGTDIVNDTTPQLGGDLDMNSKFISSGILGIKNQGSQSEMRLYCESSNAHYAALRAPAHSAFSGNLTFTLPGGYGSNNQVLTSNGSGGMSWTTSAASTSYTAGTGLTLTNNAFSLVYGNSSSNTIRKITTSTSAPSGGSDGDIWIKHN